MNTIALIVPAYNEEQVIVQTLQDLRAYCKRELNSCDIVVVNDGSTDQTGELASKYSDYVLTHRRNCGLGATIATGIEFARRKGYDACVTFDADGQHDPRDIGKAIKQLKDGYDIVIGSRFRGSHSRMPKFRQYILKLSNVVTYIFFGVKTTDSQSGFRALSRRAIEQINIQTNRMEVSSEFFAEIKNLQLSFTEVPIHIRYTEYSLKKGQSNRNAMNVLIKLLYKLAS